MGNTAPSLYGMPDITFGKCTHPERECPFRENHKCPNFDILIKNCRMLSNEELKRIDDQERLAKAAFSAYDTPKQDKEERVNHPQHYQHPSGVECITVARHHDFNIGNALKYLWRAGLKQEQGISSLDKQIEDLQKAVFYLNDEIKFLKSKQQKQ